MNDLDGFETTRILRDQYQTKIPIIAATASATREIKNKCQTAGMNDVLIKPILENDLLNCLKTYLSGDFKIKKENNQINEQEKRDAENKTKSNNFKAVFDLFQNDKSLALSMTNIYHNSLVSTITNFEKSLDNYDLDVIQTTAHKILPSTRHMGFEKLAEQLKTLEINAAKETDKKEIEDQLRGILVDSKEIIQQLEKFLESAEERIV